MVSTSRCPLLELPGELRNIIYRHVIREDQPIDITAQGYNRTKLLLANKEIHKESWKIALVENRFAIDIDEYNTDPLLKWSITTKDLIKRHTPPGETPMRLPLVLGGLALIHQRPHWRNFMTYLERVHSGELDLQCISPDILDTMVAANFGGNPPSPRALRELYAVGGIYMAVLEMADVSGPRIDWKWGPRASRLPWLGRYLFSLLLDRDGGGMLNPVLTWVDRVVPQQRGLAWRDVARVVNTQRPVLRSIRDRWDRDDLP